MNKFYVVIFIAMVSLWNCGGQQKGNNSDPNQTKEAAPGVTETPLSGLDKISKWKKASASQKLNFSEQYAISANKTAGSAIGAVDMNNCLEEAIRGLESTNELTISEVASACVDMIKQLNVRKL